MSRDWKYTEQEDKAIAEVKENGSKPSSLQHSFEETAAQANANIAEGQELKVLPDNNEEQDKVVEADSTIKSLPRATTSTTAPMNKKGRRTSSHYESKDSNKEKKQLCQPYPSNYISKV
jgi:hypothetical protein